MPSSCALEIWSAENLKKISKSYEYQSSLWYS